MADSENAKKSAGSTAGKKQMPRGGRKGGTIFPRMSLKQALEYSKKLVSKTAVASQREATILAGVFNNAGTEGKVRISALKQLGLIEGNRVAYKATQLSRDIEAAADQSERLPLLRRAVLTSKVYHELFDTYQADQASKGKIRGRAQQLGVHPDLTEKCAEFFITSAVEAGLATAEGDGIRLIAATDAALPARSEADVPEAADSEPDERPSGEGHRARREMPQHWPALPLTGTCRWPGTVGAAEGSLSRRAHALPLTSL